MTSTCRTSTSANASGKKKRSHKPLTLNAKLEMIKLSQQGMTMAEIGRKLGVPRPTVSTVVNAKEKVWKEVRSATPLNTTVIRKRDGLIADMEKLLLVWIEDQTKHNIPVSQAGIQDQALSLFNSMKAERGKAVAEDKFSASRGWFSRFKKRSNLHNTKVQDESVSADANHTLAAESYPREFYKIIEDCGYTNHQIFSLNETVTYGNKKPSRTFIIKENSIPDMKAAQNRHLLKHADSYEDFENPEEEDTANIAAVAGAFEVKVEPEDEADMFVSNDETLVDDLIEKQRRMIRDEESHPDDYPVNGEMATKELEEAINYIETGVAAFERFDPNFERSSEVNASILSGISCYQEILREKRKYMMNCSSVSNSEKVPVHHYSETESLDKSLVSVAKHTTARDLPKSPSSKQTQFMCESGDTIVPTSFLQ